MFTGKNTMLYQMPEDRITEPFGEREFSLFRSYIFDRTGIDFGPSKKHRLVNRLRRRMIANDVLHYQEYYNMVRSASDADPEVITLVDELTVNETSFFRNPGHFDALKDVVLPALRKANPSRKNPLAVWSAACSTGQEPYSLAMQLSSLEAQGLCPFSFSITATDICTRVLAQAREGVYNTEMVTGVPALLQAKYMQSKDGVCRVQDALKKKMVFKRFNLKNALPFSGFDVVFIRNVLMYFSTDQQADVIQKITKLLPSGGYLFLGDAEILRWETTRYQRERINNSIYYRKK